MKNKIENISLNIVDLPCWHITHPTVDKKPAEKIAFRPCFSFQFVASGSIDILDLCAQKLASPMSKTPLHVHERASHAGVTLTHEHGHP